MCFTNIKKKDYMFDGENLKILFIEKIGRNY